MEQILLLIFIFIISCQSAPEIKQEKELTEQEKCEEGLSKEDIQIFCR